jgi:hypothetical protein
MNTPPENGDLMAMLEELERGLSPSASAAPSRSEDRPLAEIVRIVGERQSHSQNQSKTASNGPSAEPPPYVAEPRPYVAAPSESREPPPRRQFLKADFSAIRAESSRLADDVRHRLHKGQAKAPGPDRLPLKSRRSWRPMLTAASVIVALGGLTAGYLSLSGASDTPEAALANAEADLANSASEKNPDATAPAEEASIANPSTETALARQQATQEARLQEDAPTTDMRSDGSLSTESAGAEASSQVRASAANRPDALEPAEPGASAQPAIDAPLPIKAPTTASRSAPPTSGVARAKPTPKPGAPAKSADHGQQKPPANAAKAKAVAPNPEAKHAPDAKHAHLGGNVAGEAPPPPLPPQAPMASSSSGPFGFLKRATDSIAGAVMGMGRVASGLIP